MLLRLGKLPKTERWEGEIFWGLMKYHFIFVGLEVMFIKKKFKTRKGLFWNNWSLPELNVGDYDLEDVSIILRQVIILEKLALC